MLERFAREGLAEQEATAEKREEPESSVCALNRVTIQATPTSNGLTKCQERNRERLLVQEAVHRLQTKERTSMEEIVR